MTERILFVDDEPNVLQSIKRSLRKEFDLDTAESGHSALEMIRDNGPYAVIVSDMTMPVMNGAEFLSLAKQHTPESIRLMLTGNSDQETAVAAVNEGDVFRFLNKPCESTTLAEALSSALDRYRLLQAERDLLENTLRGSIEAVAEVLSLANPEVFGRTTRIKHYMRDIANAMGLEDLWQLETTALLSQIGCVAVPGEIVLKRNAGEVLSPVETQHFLEHAGIGARILSRIPRMEAVAENIRYQEKNFDGSGSPDDDVAGEKIPLGARILRVITGYDALESGSSSATALAQLREQGEWYDPQVVVALESVLAANTSMEARAVKISALVDGMILAEDVYTSENTMLVSKGQETTATVRRHLHNFSAKELIGDTVVVWGEVVG